MPDLLQPPWPQLVSSIPAADHSVSVECATWQQHMVHFGLQAHHRAIFGGNATVSLSRARLLNHAYPNQQQKCLEILLWGYPSRIRHGLRDGFLRNIDEISERAPQNATWPAYYESLHALGNLGISTITKLAYFYGHQFGNLPSLILDSRLIEVLAAGRWQGLAMPGIRYATAAAQFPAYLQTMSRLANEMGCAPDQIELFLFSWGNAF